LSSRLFGSSESILGSSLIPLLSPIGENGIISIVSLSLIGLLDHKPSDVSGQVLAPLPLLEPFFVQFYPIVGVKIVRLSVGSELTRRRKNTGPS
jgi:hypothetical protein